ncbi:hypothetical protein FOMPIDRAFT_1023886 [Fomitopsis schrenkii]|uniref:Transmembrane protein n=1 Tax=Fomitopsis schrenkii TaxID=2126942 RepID=S8FPU1_FOMSC|nr:hypothetical protein FOMPIDRAFT_1023886 [Fomitopsis schrenkii]
MSPEIVVLYHAVFVSNCVQVSVAAMLTYEYVLAMGQGLRILRGRRTATFWLFSLNHLVMIGLVVTNVLEAIPWTQNYSCNAVAAIYDALQLLAYLIWAAISAVRAYVVSKGNRYLAGFVFALSIAQFAVSMYSDVMVTNIALVIGYGMAICDPISRFSSVFIDRAVLFTTICAIAADVLVLLATWRLTAGPEQTLRRVFMVESRGPFLNLLLRDGDVPVAQIVVTYIEALSLGTVFLVPVMSVLVSHFLRDIFQAAEDALSISNYESKDNALETGLEFRMMDQSNEISSYPSQFTDSGLA